MEILSYDDSQRLHAALRFDDRRGLVVSIAPGEGPGCGIRVIKGRIGARPASWKLPCRNAEDFISRVGIMFGPDATDLDHMLDSIIMALSDCRTRREALNLLRSLDAKEEAELEAFIGAV